MPFYFWTQDSERILWVQDKGGNENFRIYAANLTVFNVVFSLGDPWIVATAPGRKNYQAAVERMRVKLGERFHEHRY